MVKVVLGLFQRLQQAAQRGAELKLAQSGRIGGRQVDRHVIGVGVHLAQAEQVVLMGLLQRGVLVFANIDTHRDTGAVCAQAADQGFYPLIVESHAVDQRLLVFQPEQAGGRIARLGPWCDCAHLHKTEAETGEGGKAGAVLVKACGHTDRVRKIESHDPHRHLGGRTPRGTQQTQLLPGSQQTQTERVRRFRIKTKQQRTRQGVNSGRYHQQLLPLRIAVCTLYPGGRVA